MHLRCPGIKAIRYISLFACFARHNSLVSNGLSKRHSEAKPAMVHSIVFIPEVKSYMLVSIVTIKISNEMFVRVLTVHCDQNNSYEITINGYQVRKVNEIRKVIFGLCCGKPSSALRSNLGCSPS